MQRNPGQTNSGQPAKAVASDNAAGPFSGNVDAVYALQLVMKTVPKLLSADRSTVFLMDHEKQELWSLLADGVGLNEIRLPLSTGIAGHVAQTGDVVNVADAYSDPRFYRDIDEQTGYRTRELLCMPLQDRGGRIIGVIEVMNKQDGPFTADDEIHLEEVCSRVAMLLSAPTAYGPLR